MHIKTILQICKTTIELEPVWFFINLLMLIIWSSCSIFSGYTNKLLVDAIIRTKMTATYNIGVALPILLFFLSMMIAGNTQNFDQILKTIYTKKAKKLYTNKFMNKVTETDQDYFYNHEWYNEYEFVKRNIEQTTNVVVTLFNRFFIAVFELALGILAISIFDIYIVLAICLLSVLLIILNKYLIKKRILLEEKHISDERKANYYKDLLLNRRNAKEVRLNNIKNEFIERWEASFRKSVGARFRFDILSTLLTSIIGLLDTITPCLVAIYILNLVLHKDLTAGNAVFITSITWSINWGIRDIVNILSSELSTSFQYADRYMKFISTTKQPKEIKDEQRVGMIDYLALKNVCYRYPGSEKDALKNINLTIKKGEIVSILGYNGSGKTTLTRIMCGLLRSYTGDVTINGHNIREISEERLYRLFGVGFQDFARYSLSIRENIGVGMIEKMNDETEIQKAIEKGNIGPIIDKLPNGIDTMLGKDLYPNGYDLSGGEWQRLILSRAYMGNPEVFVLDEPTASVDPLEEMKMLEHLRDIIQGRTAILISHRIGFARLSDRIIVMDAGEICEEGSHNELINKKGRYYELFTAQKELYEECDLSEHVS